MESWEVVTRRNQKDWEDLDRNSLECFDKLVLMTGFEN